ncbi:hypothetical protein NDU88_006584 [Pleurodeles waltl]|uniref:Uncharacterized protein n=1 Tax=Pleurodeles waltl TaxID=8319 RepID=A0AAV7MZP4_PLEWA|nr:hypothetical protein NDU88_006584 [Pleurodeles waltl]
MKRHVNGLSLSCDPASLKNVLPRDQATAHSSDYGTQQQLDEEERAERMRLGNGTQQRLNEEERLDEEERAERLGNDA